MGAVVACLLALASCGSDADPAADGRASGESQGSSRAPRTAHSADAPADDRQVKQVVALLTEPPPESGQLAIREFYDDRRAFLEAMSSDDAELGLRLIAYLETRPELPELVLRGVTEAIARTESLEAGDFLAALVTEYGASLAMRGTAAENLWRTSPERALATIEPLLRERPRSTTPPGESLLNGWLEAKRVLGEDPSEVLALLATDLYREDAVRHASIKALGSCKTPTSRAALSAVLVESTGNFYLRRLAAQTIMKAFERDEACRRIEEVLSLEADMNMQIFLADLFTRNCP